jgi:hypothetical protein
MGEAGRQAVRHGRDHHAAVAVADQHDVADVSYSRTAHTSSTCVVNPMCGVRRCERSPRPVTDGVRTS